jgi:uncharacterized protein YbaR (Trm112 family)
MIKESLLEVLCCPESRQKVEIASQEIIDEVNQRIESGEAKDKEGKTISEIIEVGLIRTDGRILYPIRDGIPIMLINEGIVLKG